MTCDPSDGYSLDPEPKLPSEEVWGGRLVFHTEHDVGELKRRLERVRRELACYKRAMPGYLYSAKCDILVDAQGIGTYETDP